MAADVRGIAIVAVRRTLLPNRFARSGLWESIRSESAAGDGRPPPGGPMELAAGFDNGSGLSALPHIGKGLRRASASAWAFSSSD